VLQLAPVDPSDEGTEPEPPRPGGGAPRPALKRVK